MTSVDSQVPPSHILALVLYSDGMRFTYPKSPKYKYPTRIARLYLGRSGTHWSVLSNNAHQHQFETTICRSSGGCVSKDQLLFSVFYHDCTGLAFFKTSAQSKSAYAWSTLTSGGPYYTGVVVMLATSTRYLCHIWRCQWEDLKAILTNNALLHREHFIKSPLVRVLLHPGAEHSSRGEMSLFRTIESG